VILVWDRHAERWLVAHRFADWLWEALSRIGMYGAVWLALGVVLAVVHRRPSSALWALAAYLTAALSASGLQAAIPRERPRLPTLLPRPGTHSFPSGHATTSFACAALLAAVEPRLRVPLYVLAALIAFSRLEVGVHFPLDVIAGSALGLALGGVVRALRRREASHRRQRPQQQAG
jgi:undecaprenyl-diphosphatase